MYNGTALDLLSKQFPPDPNYIEYNILPKGGTLLIGGEAKSFKSFIMLEVIRALTCGKPFLEHDQLIVPVPVKVLYIEAENGERANQDRIKRIFEKEDSKIWGDKFHIISKDLNFNFDSPKGVMNIISAIKDTEAKVLILDPISFLFHKDENSATEVGKLAFTLGQIKEQFSEQNLSIVFSHHFGKRPWGQAAVGFDALSEYNFRGSSKWKDMGDSTITTQKVQQLQDEPFQTWKNKMRFLTRHGEIPPEIFTVFNENNDLRVKILKTKGDMGKKQKPLKMQEVKPEDMVKQDPPKNGKFEFSEMVKY